LGADYLGGMDGLWDNLPRPQRRAFANFNEDSDFPTVGIFWQDAIANSAMLYFLNQGIIMRYLAAKSVNEARKATFAAVLVLMTVGAIVVASGGWVAAALVNHGDLPSDLKPDQAFYVVTELLSRPGLFGLILASLTAALMSTVDTLITAVSAVYVNDIYRPYVRPGADERRILRTARLAALTCSVVGLLLVPIYSNFRSIYEAHGAFTAAVTPPLVVTLLLSVFWRRFTAAAATWTLAGGGAAILLSIFVPQLVEPFAHGVAPGDPGQGPLAGMNQHQYMRALYGLVVCTVIGVVVSWITRPEKAEKQAGLVWGTIAEALRQYKGSAGSEHRVTTALAPVRSLDHEPVAPAPTDLPVVRVSARLADDLKAQIGDVLYVSDCRWWLGGLRSTHAVLGEIQQDSGEACILLGPAARKMVVARGRQDRPLRIQRLY
jgi:solute:Na+ symporter, SSS family